MQIYTVKLVLPSETPFIVTPQYLIGVTAKRDLCTWRPYLCGSIRPVSPYAYKRCAAGLGILLPDITLVQPLKNVPDRLMQFGNR